MGEQYSKSRIQDESGKFKSEQYQLLGGINSKAGIYVNGPQEFRNLVNLNFFNPGALTQRQGTSLYVGATVIGKINGGWDFQRLNGSTYIIVAANTNLYSLSPPNSFNPVVSGLSNNLTDFVTFVDRLFFCNGTNFLRYDGTIAYNYSLPVGNTSTFGVTQSLGVGGFTGTFVCSYAYVNERGYVGPCASGITLVTGTSGTAYSQITFYGMTAPNGFGVTAFLPFRSSPSGVAMFGITTVPGTSTTFVDTGYPLTTQLFNTNLYFSQTSLMPRFIEIFNNQLFMGGFSAQPSRVYWSNIGEPEGVDPSFFAEFRTNDGDRLTGLKVYNGVLIVTKQRSVHRVIGDNPSNFAIQQITQEYGCMGNNALVTFNNVCWMIDNKGIIEYNGSNIRCVSDPVEPFFQQMNLAASLDTCCAIHNKQYNEVWFSFPSGNSTTNNTVLVYDYLANAWTTYAGINPSVLFTAQGTQSVRTVFFGGYTGSVSFVGSSFVNDNGNAITCMMDAMFMAPSGQTTDNQFRRLYIDTVPTLGLTLPIQINLKTNYQQTIQATSIMYSTVFQSRIDFGLPARSIAMQAIYSSASFPIQINGYSYAYRYQRDV